MKISVVIPTFNRADLIVRSVKSVTDQTAEPYEVIVVDDGSTDNTREAVESIGSPLVKYVSRKNGGAGAARNTGVSVAGGDWIAFNDSDDVWRSDKLEKQVSFVEQNPECDLIYSAYMMHLEDGRSAVVPQISDGLALSGELFVPLLVRNTIGAPTVLVKKEQFNDIGGFDERLRSFEDWDFALRFAKDHKIGFLDDVTVDAYGLAGGVSSHIADAFDYRCRVICENRDILQRNGLFDRAVTELFTQASNLDCLETVKKMFILYLSKQAG